MSSGGVHGYTQENSPKQPEQGRQTPGVSAKDALEQYRDTYLGIIEPTGLALLAILEACQNPDTWRELHVEA
jgi:hypothetical protein